MSAGPPAGLWGVTGGSLGAQGRTWGVLGVSKAMEAAGVPGEHLGGKMCNE